MDTEDKKVTLRDGEGSTARKGMKSLIKPQRELREEFWDEMDNKFNIDTARRNREKHMKNDLGFSKELCEFLGIDPTEMYYVDETEKQRLVAKTEMIVAHAGVVAAKYLLAMLAGDHIVDSERAKMSMFLIKMNIGEPPPRMVTEASAGAWEVLMKETNTSVREIKVRVADNPDGNGNGK